MGYSLVVSPRQFHNSNNNKTHRSREGIWYKGIDEEYNGFKSN